MSRLSPYLHFGVLSARYMHHALTGVDCMKRSKTLGRRLAWRDLAYWQLHHWPSMPHTPIRPHYAAQPWAPQWQALLLAWQQGQTVSALVGERGKPQRVEKLDSHCADGLKCGGGCNRRATHWWTRRCASCGPLDGSSRVSVWQPPIFSLRCAVSRDYHSCRCRRVTSCCSRAQAKCSCGVTPTDAVLTAHTPGAPWMEGAVWFHDTLVDADLAINSMMWQNAGMAGMDPWSFSISPVSRYQDPSAAYVRAWVPELARLPTKFVHEPWKAPPAVLDEAGIVLGVTYPCRVVTDLAAAKTRAAASVHAVCAPPWPFTGKYYGFCSWSTAEVGKAPMMWGWHGSGKSGRGSEVRRQRRLRRHRCTQRRALSRRTNECDSRVHHQRHQSLI